MFVEVTLLDGSETKIEVEGISMGEDLLTRVAEQINLAEKDYFGFLYVDHRDNTLSWLHMDKSLSKRASFFFHTDSYTFFFLCTLHGGLEHFYLFFPSI